MSPAFSTFRFVCLMIITALAILSTAQAQALEVMMTAYSSTVAQTNSDPFTTSTMQRVRPGIVAVSRDLLGSSLPYGTQLRVVHIEENPRACGGWDPNMILEVQDTMHRRKRNQIDIWMPSTRDAIRWGRCRVRLEVI